MATTTTTTATARAHGATAGRRRRAAAALAALALVGLAACAPSGSEPQETPTVTQEPEIPSQRGAAPAPVVPTTWPLTGVVTPEVANRPAVAVKVENTNVARPQAGLDQADVVWETIVEFEVSRFVAVFHSQVPAEIGPIRSVRPMDPAIVAPLHGMLAFSGGQPGILELVRNSGAQLISHDAGAPGLYRVSGRSAPHNVMGSMETWLAEVDGDHAAPPPEQFAFARRAELATATLAGTPATTLRFDMSAQAKPSWTFDAATGTWLRSEGSTPATAAGGARLAATNVVAITAAHPNSPFGAQGGAPVPTYELVGSGDAVVATAGKTVPARWTKAAVDAPMQLTTADGAPLLLAPGVTWVELVPQGTGSFTIG